MLLNIIILIVIAICLLLIVFIVARKFPRLKTLDIDTVPRARTDRMRDRILLEKIRRSTAKSKEAVKQGARPLFAKIKSWLKRGADKVFELERHYQKEAAKKNVLRGPELARKIDELLGEAEKAGKEQSFAEAEKFYIEVVALSPENIPAYEGLAKIYVETKEFKQALQTYQFILKLLLKGNKDSKSSANAIEAAVAHSNIGAVYAVLEKNDKALASFEAALALEPNNPRHLDKIIETSILLNKKDVARAMLEKLKEVNPENQKAREYEEEIGKM